MVKASNPYFPRLKHWAARRAFAIAYWSTAIDLMQFALLSI